MTVTSSVHESVSLDWLLERVPARTPPELAEGIAELIRSGELAPGVQLPTIREFARHAGLSIGSVLAAWNILRDGGLVQTHRRAGTRVLGELPTVQPVDVAAGGPTILDLAQNAPDIALQPALGAALLSALDDRELNVFGREFMTERLLAAVEPDWPFPVGSWSTAGGGTEAILLATAAAAPSGSLVAVDEPLSPGFMDTLHDLGLRPIGVVSDDDGPIPASLEAALSLGAKAFIFQPGAPFAMHHSLTAERAAALAAVVAAHDGVVVVEDDSIGPLGRDVPPSTGAALPDRVIRVRSYCKAYGIDVRTSVIGGARPLVERAISLRSHGVGSNSRILQNALAHLIGSNEANAAVARARDAYATRRGALIEGLRAEGITVHSGPNSLVVWVEVPSEANALVRLAQEGIAVGAGSTAFVTSPERPLIRVSVTLVPDDEPALRALVTAIARVAAPSREYFD
jgi:DNA-binding transcriptional MocR family regulator